MHTDVWLLVLHCYSRHITSNINIRLLFFQGVPRFFDSDCPQNDVGESAVSHFKTYICILSYRIRLLAPLFIFTYCAVFNFFAHSSSIVILYVYSCWEHRDCTRFLTVQLQDPPDVMLSVHVHSLLHERLLSFEIMQHILHILSRLHGFIWQKHRRAFDTQWYLIIPFVSRECKSILIAVHDVFSSWSFPLVSHEVETVFYFYLCCWLFPSYKLTHDGAG